MCPLPAGPVLPRNTSEMRAGTMAMLNAEHGRHRDGHEKEDDAGARHGWLSDVGAAVSSAEKNP